MYRQFGHASSKRFASPELRSVWGSTRLSNGSESSPKVDAWTHALQKTLLIFVLMYLTELHSTCEMLKKLKYVLCETRHGNIAFCWTRHTILWCHILRYTHDPDSSIMCTALHDPDSSIMCTALHDPGRSIMRTALHDPGSSIMCTALHDPDSSIMRTALHYVNLTVPLCALQHDMPAPFRALHCTIDMSLTGRHVCAAVPNLLAVTMDIERNTADVRQEQLLLLDLWELLDNGTPTEQLHGTGSSQTNWAIHTSWNSFRRVTLFLDFIVYSFKISSLRKFDLFLTSC